MISLRKKYHHPLRCKLLLLSFGCLLTFFAGAQTGTEEDSLGYIPPAEDDIITETSISKHFLSRDENSTDTIQIRKVPDNVVKRMQKDDDFWYANAEIKKEKKAEDKKSDYTSLGQQQWLQTLLWIVIIGGFAAGLIWYLAGSNVGLFRRKDKSLRSREEEEELVTEDIFAINYQKEIDKAEAKGNFRLAIRLMFLRLLKEMADKNIIQYKQDKTNFDYLLQLQPTGYYNNFFRITRNYEYSWYGKFNVTEDAYKIIRSDFNRFDSQLR